ncbi:LOW QUALITY PROTEIN: hypothetical protein CRUP_005109 [Coryphaenoides rupestris]|nr:LOW QUALITY PROTEIN: hypothetical protein CRUP_005109 [Coryphaenoides rupestris]
MEGVSRFRPRKYFCIWTHEGREGKGGGVARKLLRELKHQKRCEEAATTIAAFWHGALARMKLKRLKEEARRKHAVAVIWAYWLGLQEHRRGCLEDLATLIQKIYRGWKVPDEDLRASIGELFCRDLEICHEHLHALPTACHREHLVALQAGVIGLAEGVASTPHAHILHQAQATWWRTRDSVKMWDAFLSLGFTHLWNTNIKRHWITFFIRVPTEALNWKPAVGGLFRLTLAGLPSGKSCLMRLWLALYMACERSRYSRSLFLSMKPSTRNLEFLLRRLSKCWCLAHTVFSLSRKVLSVTVPGRRHSSSSMANMPFWFCSPDQNPQTQKQH